MALTYANGITTNESGQVVGVGNLTGNGQGNTSNYNQPAGWTPTAAVTAAPSGQLISQNDPNTQVYKGQASINGQTAPQTQSINMLNTAAQSSIPLQTAINNFQALPNKYSDIKLPEVMKPVERPVEFATTATKKVSEAEKMNQQVSNYQLKNPAIAQANPGVIANPQYIDALYREAYNRRATSVELAKFANSSVKDAANLILGQSRSPFAIKAGATNLPGANTQNPDSQTPPELKYQDPTGIMDIEKFSQDIGKQLDDLNRQINDAYTSAAEIKTQYGESNANIGNQVGVGMSLIQGQQAYQNQMANFAIDRKQAQIDSLIRNKAAVTESADMKLKLYDYARSLRKDQQDAMAKMIDLSLSNATIPSEQMVTSWATAAGVNPQAAYDMFAVAAKNAQTKNATATIAATLDNTYKQAQIDALNKAKSTFTKIGSDAEGNDIYGFVDTAGQTVKPVNTTISDSKSYFTDANGDNWNIAGWAANDISKQASMQSVANKIGKVTTENINQKVSQFTPGLTANMIKNTSANTGVSWEAIMTMVAQEAQGGLSPVAQKNNNFGGLTFNNQEWIKPYGGTVGTSRPASEGGNYIKFPTKQAGLDAMGALMASYGKVSSSTPIASKIDETAKNYVTLDAKISDIKGGTPKETAALIASYLKQKVDSGQLSKTDAESNAKLQDKIVQIDDAINKVGTAGSGIIGPTWLSRWSLGNTITGAEAAFAGNIHQLISKETMDSLVGLKKQGGTLGALSDQERIMLQNAATKLGGWEVKDSNGNPTGVWSVSEKDFKKELEQIKSLAQRAITNAGNDSGIVNSLSQNLASDPSKIDEYNALVQNNPNLSEDEINQALGF